MTDTFSSMYSWWEFAPAIGLAALAILLLMADTFLPKFPKRAYAAVGAIGSFCAAYACWSQYACCPTGWLGAFACVACVATGVCLLLNIDYHAITCESVNGGQSEEGSGEFSALPLIAAAGICALSHARDLIMLFVGLETVTLSSYVLVGYYRRNQGSIEAGIKYLILGALSTGLLVFGAAWYYGMTGELSLNADVVTGALSGGPMNAAIIHSGFVMALCFLIAAGLFKIGAAPMHTWIPDVYQGAPTPVSAFLAVASKVAGFIFLIILLTPVYIAQRFGAPDPQGLLIGMAVIAAATLLIGNLGAIPQRNAKRLLGYSSIGQAGFILAFFQGGVCRSEATLFYLIAYGLATLPAFCAIALVRAQRGSEEISAFRGLARTNPRLAFLITVCFASLAGVPLTWGFLAKLFSFLSLLDSPFRGDVWMAWTLLGIMVVCAAAGFYYYFKIIRAMYWEKPLPGDKPLRLPLITGCIITVCVIALLVVGTLPIFCGSCVLSSSHHTYIWSAFS